MRCVFLTSGDYALAGSVFLDLIKRVDHEFTFIDVYEETKSLDLKPLKIFFLFGILGTLRFLYRFFSNRQTIKGSRTFTYFKINKSDLYNFLEKHEFDQIILNNFAWKFDSIRFPNTINCHPSLLPDFKGLMPICHNIQTNIKENKEFKTGATIHIIDENFDQGQLVWQTALDHASSRNLYDIYKHTYLSFSEGLSEFLNTRSPKTEKMPEGGAYFKSMGWKQVLNFKGQLLKHDQFLRFLINGGVIGIISWALQTIFYLLLKSVFEQPEYLMLTSVWSAFFVVLLINFASLERFVFQKKGFFWRFCCITTSMIFCVGVLSEIYFNLINMWSATYATYFSYPVAAITIAPLSFLIKKYFIFNKTVQT